MDDYEFQSTLYRTAGAMARAIAEEFLSASGANDEAQQLAVLAECSDAELADEAIEGWGLSGEWAEENDFSRDLLIDAIAALRKSKMEA